MKILLRNSLFLLTIIASLSSCSLFDKEEQIPSYIYVDSVGINPNYVDFGSNSHNITDVWVYLNDELLGCYELPARIPILAEGNNKLTFYAGVKINGMSALRATYPFYATKDYNIYLRNDSALTIKPMFDFVPSCELAFNEDFESAGIIFEKTLLSDTNIQSTAAPEDVFINTQNSAEVSNYSGVVYLDTARTVFEVQNIVGYDLPKNGTYVFLEMNYKCTTPIQVGVKAFYSSSMVRCELIGLNPTNTWKKVYVNLTSKISEASSATSFKIYFAGALRTGATSDKVLFDNIKLIHPKTTKK